MLQAFSEFSRRRQRPPEPPGDWSELDRRLFTQMLQGLLRHHRLLRHLVQERLHPGIRLNPIPEAILLLGTLELLWLDRVPDHATLNEAVGLTRRLKHPRAAGMVNGVLRTLQRDRDSGRLQLERFPLALRTSHPDWMVERWEQQWGADLTARLCESNNAFTGITLAPGANWSREHLQSELEKEGVTSEAHPEHLAALKVTGQSGAPVWQTEAWVQGGCWVQDVSSQIFLDAFAPLFQGRGADLCAAPGGKSLGVLCRNPELQDLTLCDVSGERLAPLRQNLQRMGFPGVSVQEVDGTKTPFDDRSFDWVLLDVPCSSTGTIRKNPDIKWSRSAEELLAAVPLQRQLLHEAARLVAPQGRLIYATCSLEPEENADQARWFLEQHPEFDLLPVHQFAPESLWQTPAGALEMMTDSERMGFYAVAFSKKALDFGL
ncbi:MAG: RsmB/NOP family class I SAM-dependent RNA methyltransferase [bacterium]